MEFKLITEKIVLINEHVANQQFHLLEMEKYIA